MMPERVKKIGVATFAVIVGWAGSVMAGVWIASAYTSNMTTRVDNGKQVADDHELRLRALESKVTDIAADTRWIVNTMRSQAKQP